MNHATGPQLSLYSFDDVVVDCAAGQVRKGDQVRKITPRAFRVLVYLLRQRGRIVDKQELFENVWKGTFVTDNALTRTIAEIRRVVGDHAEKPGYLETVPKRGYRFIAEVEVSQAWTPSSAEKSGQYEVPQSDMASLPGAGVLPDAVSGGSVEPAPTSRIGGIRTPLRLGRRRFLLFAALVLAVAGIAGWFALLRSPRVRPLTATLRTVPFTSLTGREKWPAFSPDGNQIAFSWEGDKRDNFDIYVQIVGTGEPLRLTQHPGMDVCPAWSPDGRTIAFIREHEGNVTLLSVPALRGPDRTLIPLNFTRSWYGQYPDVSWSPDGKLIAFPDKTRGKPAPTIWLLSLDTLKKRPLTRLPKGYFADLYPAFSPDGERVAFTRWRSEGIADVYVVSPKDGQPVRLTFDDSLVSGLAWMPDGKSIVFSSTRGGSLKLWRVPLEGGTPELLSSGGDNPLPGMLSPFAISRVGHRLAYEKSLEDYNIWRIEIPGSTTPASQPVKLIASSQHESGAQFSPDGKRIAFESLTTGTFEVWVCDADGANPLPLTSFGGPMAGTPRWSPDNQQIAFDARPQGHSDIFVVSGKGGAIRQVTKEPSNDVVPSWSQDGRWIYFASNRSGDVQIWKIPASGGEALQVTKNGGFSAFESVDGQFLYYAKITESGIWRAPVSGGQETLVADVVEPGLWGYWALAPGGIYYVNLDSPRNHTIDFFDFFTKEVTRVAALTEEIRLETSDPALSVSPDGRLILYSQLDRAESDIMLVENFR